MMYTMVQKKVCVCLYYVHIIHVYVCACVHVCIERVCTCMSKNEQMIKQMRQNVNGIYIQISLKKNTSSLFHIR